MVGVARVAELRERMQVSVLVSHRISSKVTMQKVNRTVPLVLNLSRVVCLPVLCMWHGVLGQTLSAVGCESPGKVTPMDL